MHDHVCQPLASLRESRLTTAACAARMSRDRVPLQLTRLAHCAVFAEAAEADTKDSTKDDTSLETAEAATTASSVTAGIAEVTAGSAAVTAGSAEAATPAEDKKNASQSAVEAAAVGDAAFAPKAEGGDAQPAVAESTGAADPAVPAVSEPAKPMPRVVDPTAPVGCCTQSATFC